jgi:Cu2+-exporting ATPase
MPAIAYAGQPFFRSALGAIRSGRLNMDVPISLGIILATAMSLFQTMRGGDQVYFDAAIMLTFFLLIGRYLDESVRVRAKGAAENLLGLKALAATVIGADGKPRRMPARALTPGMRVLVAAGERIPVDGRLMAGASEVEESLITGETVPRLVRAGGHVHAGTVNITTPIEVEATATDENTLIAEIGRLMQAADLGRGRYVRLADRAARAYAPAVHVLGAATLVGWLLAGAGWEQSLTYAIAVLYALRAGAAVPAVQVAAAGVIVKAPDALSASPKLTIVFDKTGTLTLASCAHRSRCHRRRCAEARGPRRDYSRHPYSRAIVRPRRLRAGARMAWLGEVAEAVSFPEPQGEGGSAPLPGSAGDPDLRAPMVPPQTGRPRCCSPRTRCGDAAGVVSTLKQADTASARLRRRPQAVAAAAPQLASSYAGVRPTAIARLDELARLGRSPDDRRRSRDALRSPPDTPARRQAPPTSADGGGRHLQGEVMAPIVETIASRGAARVPGEFHRARLQCAARAPRHGRIRDAADRRARHVRILDRRHGQRVAAADRAADA